MSSIVPYRRYANNRLPFYPRIQESSGPVTIEYLNEIGAPYWIQSSWIIPEEMLDIFATKTFRFEAEFDGTSVQPEGFTFSPISIDVEIPNGCLSSFFQGIDEAPVVSNGSGFESLVDVYEDYYADDVLPPNGSCGVRHSYVEELDSDPLVVLSVDFNIYAPYSFSIGSLPDGSSIWYLPPRSENDIVGSYATAAYGEVTGPNPVLTPLAYLSGYEINGFLVGYSNDVFPLLKITSLDYF